MGHASLESEGSDSLGGAEGQLVWCCVEMAVPESQSSSAGAATKGLNRVEEAESWFECLSGWFLFIEMM